MPLDFGSNLSSSGTIPTAFTSAGMAGIIAFSTQHLALSTQHSVRLVILSKPLLRSEVEAFGAASEPHAEIPSATREPRDAIIVRTARFLFKLAHCPTRPVRRWPAESPTG